MDAVGADQADRTELVAAWTELWRRINKVWIIHMRVTGPAYNLLDELGEVYSELTGRPPTDAPVLVQGRADTLQDLERGLQELVRAIRAAPAVAAALEAGELRSLDALAALAGGATVREAIDAFLQRFGDAGQLAIDLRSPAWRDEPGLLLAELARRMRAELEDPDARVARLRATSDALAAEIRASLAGRPEDLARFEEVLAVARAAGPLTEEHNFWIDRLVSSYARRAVLRFADRLVRDGSLDSPANVFFFWVAELSEALAAPRDLRPVARERARELRRSERLRPPRIIGAAPAAGGGAPNARMIDLGYRVEQTGDGEVLQGVPASAGVARGPARLIRDSSRFDRFTKGDVLVCRSSNVSWIPLFTMASAVIADVGGALSHAAVVAREFGVPAVVGTGTALDLLVDGELVEVDGTAGTVRRLGATAG
jgi:pyruvate,water dikinase